jgi:hypothetical protein
LFLSRKTVLHAVEVTACGYWISVKSESVKSF